MNKKIFIFLFFLFVLISMSAVSAADSDYNNDTIVLSDDAEILSVANDADAIGIMDGDNADGNYAAFENDATLGNVGENYVNDSLSENNDELNGDSADGTFTDLKNKLQGESKVTLDRNYTYVDADGILDHGIDIRDIEIDGNGYTINGNNKSKVFNAYGNITLKNINFINSNTEDIHESECVISFSGNENKQLTVTNCNFTNNYIPYSWGIAIYMYDGKLTVRDCRFENNTSPIGYTIYSGKDVEATISDCTFVGTSKYAVVATNSNILRCTFINGSGVEGENNYFYNNTFINCKNVIKGLNNKIRNNNFSNNSGDIINMEGYTYSAVSSEIINNTFINNHDANIRFHDRDSTSNSKFANNWYIDNTNFDITAYESNFVNETFINNSRIRLILEDSDVSYSKFFNNTNLMNVIHGKRVKITDNDFISNSANDGVINVQSSNILHNVFINNNASSGGAIYGFLINITDNSFINNSASNGGAIQITEGGVTNIVHNVFSNNSASSKGGAVNAESILKLCTLNSTNNSFIDNFAKYGGAIYMSRVCLKIDNCTFTNNRADTGASIYNDNENTSMTSPGVYSTLEVFNSNFNTNKANATGGVIYTSNNFFGNDANITINNTNFVRNTPDIYDGAIKLHYSNLIFDLKNKDDESSIFDVEVKVGFYSRSTVLGREFIVVATFNGTTDDEGHLEFDLASKTTSKYAIITITERNSGESRVSLIPIVINQIMLIVPSVNKSYGGPENLRITLRDSMDFIGGVNVTIKIDDGDDIIKTTDSRGRAYVDLDLNAGNHTAKVSYKTASVTANIIVNKCPTNITANNIELFVGDEANVTYELNPENAVGDVRFISNDTGVANVDAETGCINAVGQGTATITISFTGSENYMPSNANVTVTATLDKIPTNIALENVTMTLKANDIVSSGANLTPADAGNLTYTSSNSNVVIVEEGKIKALEKGNATITVSFAGNDDYAPAENKTISVTVNLNDASVAAEDMELKVGEKGTVEYITDPDGLNVSFVADDSGVVSVNGVTGVVTALKRGTATITVNVGDDKKYALNSTVITVTVSLNDASVFAEDMEMTVTDNATINYVTTPEGLNVTFVVDNSGVVSVSDDGVVSALKGGVAKITIYAGDGKKYAINSTEITVTVNKFDAILTVDDVRTVYNTTRFVVATLTDVNGNVLSDIKVKIVVGNLTEIAMTDENGQVSLDITTLEPGEYAIRARSSGINDIYNEFKAFAHATVYSEKFNTTLTVPDVYVIGNSSGVVVATLKDDEGKVLSDIKVKIVVGDLSVIALTDAKGQVSLDISGLAPGEYKISARSSGVSDLYKEAKAYAKAVVSENKLETTLTVPDVYVIGNTSSAVVATLTDSEGKAISGVNVKIVVGDLSVTAKTNAKGQVSLDIGSLAPGQYKVSARSSGASYIYKEAKATAKAIVSENKLETTLTVPDVVLVGNSSGAVVATLKDSYGNLISGVNVKLVIGDLTVTAKTDENGQVSVDVSDLAPGVYKVSARSSGVSDVYKEAKAYAKVIVSEEKLDTTLTVPDVVVDGSSSGVVVATLKDSYNYRVSGVNVKITVGDLTKTAKTDENGQVSLDISTLAPGEYKISARSSGVSDIYNESKATAKATVYAN